MYHIDIQNAADKALSPALSLLKQWAKKVLSSKKLNKKLDSAELSIRIVTVDEMSELNSTYRHKKGPTNVLSFPFALSEDIQLEIPLLGDIVICAEVVNREALEQGKTAEEHWAHMIVHGIFHLLGYDHETDEEADIMEPLEIEMMHTLGFANPYKHRDDIKQYD